MRTFINKAVPLDVSAYFMQTSHRYLFLPVTNLLQTSHVVGVSGSGE